MKKETVKGKNRIILLLDEIETFGDETLTIPEIRRKVIEKIKNSKSETKAGYLYMTEKSLLVARKISKNDLRKAVNNASKEKLLKKIKIKEERIVVYTKERRVRSTMM